MKKMLSLLLVCAMLLGLCACANSAAGEGETTGAGGMMESTMTEGFYDPVLGYVTFGEVYATYYAEYLQALRDGKVPEELQEKMDKYFSGLE